MYLRTKLNLDGIGAPLDLAKAVRLNRCMREWLGWQQYHQRLSELVGFRDRTPTEEAFARAVADWQRRRGLDDDGIVGPATLDRMRPSWGMPPQPLPERPWWIQWIPSPNHLDRQGEAITAVVLHATSAVSYETPSIPSRPRTGLDRAANISAPALRPTS